MGGLKLLNYFINNGYFEETNMYLGDNLSVNNYDIPFSSLRLLAMCKSNNVNFNYGYFLL
jgi:hypothetical protein